MKKAIIALLTLIIPIVAIYAYMGGFNQVEITQAKFKSREIIFDIHRGPYTGLKQSWESFERKFKKLGLAHCYSFGIYLDSPETPEDKLRSVMACELKNIALTIKNNLRKEFSYAVLPAASGYSAVFPYRNELSFMFAPIKVYPEFEAKIKAGELKPVLAIEEYGFNKGRSAIEFFMPQGIDKSKYKSLFEAFEEEQ